MKELPNQVEVIVVGGGVVGLSTLYHLGGVSDAILLEKNELTSGTTWHSAANVRSLRPNRNLTKLIGYGIELYQELQQETGQSTGWINAGSISLATSEDRLEDLRRQQALSSLFGIETLEITGAEIEERWPLVNTADVLSGMWSPEDGRVSPSDLSAAYAKGARAKGCKIFEHHPVEEILIDGGKVRGVRTKGQEVVCEKVIICAGLWSRKIGEQLGIDIPLYACEHFYLLTKSIKGLEGNLPTLIDSEGGLYIRDDSGGLLVGTFEEKGKQISVDALGENFAFGLLEEDWDHFGPLMEHALHRVPALAEAEVKTLLNGPESFTPDNQFLLGEHADIEGLILGCGMNSVGVASSGGIGKVLSHLVRDGRMPMDMHESEPSRMHLGLNEEKVIAPRVEEVLGRRFAVPYPGYEWQTSRGLRYTPLYEAYASEKPHLTQAYGWERALYFGKEQEPVLTFGKPAWFDNVGAEVVMIHENVGMFDLSMYGKILIEGPDALPFMERVCTNNMDVDVDRLVYTSLLDNEGGFISDVTVLRLGPASFRMITGAVTLRKDLMWLSRACGNYDVQLKDETTAFSLIGLMGPRSDEVLKLVGAGNLTALKFFHHGESSIAGCHVRGARLSYVGERGVEITMRSEDALEVCRTIAAEEVGFAGFYAQESMRLEKGYVAFGHDIDADDTPFAAGLGFTVSSKKDFIGKERLFKRERQCRLVSLLFDDDNAVAWGHEPVLKSGTIIGETRSAGYGYRLGCPLALAMILETHEPPEEGEELEVQIGIKKYTCKVVYGAPYDKNLSIVK